MDSLVFYIDADKADSKVLESIKAFFGNRRVQISVQPDETTYTLDDLAHRVAENRASPVAYVFKGDEFADVAAKLLKDEPVDSSAYKQTNER